MLVLDEAHERSLNTDLLLGLLTRIVPQRRRMHAASAAGGAAAAAVAPLKLVIMSATLQVDMILRNERLFPATLYPAGPPPVLEVEARCAQISSSAVAFKLYVSDQEISAGDSTAGAMLRSAASAYLGHLLLDAASRGRTLSALRCR